MIRHAALAIIVLLTATPAMAQTLTHRDNTGNLTGTTSREGDRWVDRAPNGNITGYQECHGNSCVDRAPNGNLTGRSNWTGR